MPPSWLRSLTHKIFGSPPVDNDPKPLPGPTPRDRWSVDGIYFDTTGWSLAEASATSMSWTVGSCVMSLARTRRDPAESPPSAIVAARRQQRAMARAIGRDIISVEPSPAPGGVIGLEVITKGKMGLGFDFEGTKSIPYGDDEFTIRLAAPERMTGMRESIVSSQRFLLGEVKLDVAFGPDGGRRILDWLGDPYDAEFDDGALNCVSDDCRLDPVIQAHPLSFIRDTLRHVSASLEIDGVVAPPEPSAGPSIGRAPARFAISPAALREIYWTAGRNDLLGIQLAESLAAADADGASGHPDTARLLLMKAFMQMNTNEYGQAARAASRAYAIFAAETGGRDRDSGVALVTLGLTQRRLTQWASAERSLRSAIEVFDEVRYDGLHMTMALGLLGDTIARQGRLDDAAIATERAQEALKERPMKEGLISLRELAGGPPPDAVVKVNTYPMK